MVGSGTGVGAVAVAGNSSPAGAAPGVGNLQQGSSGAGVACVQYALAFTVDPNITVDGIFGSQTKADVKAFQQAVGVAADGIVGPNTGDYILAEDANIGIFDLCWPVVPSHF